MRLKMIKKILIILIPIIILTFNNRVMAADNEGFGSTWIESVQVNCDSIMGGLTKMMGFNDNSKVMYTERNAKEVDEIAYTSGSTEKGNCDVIRDLSVLEDDYKIPIIGYSLDTILQNHVAIFDVNFLKSDVSAHETEDGNYDEWYDLRQLVISGTKGMLSISFVVMALIFAVIMLKKHVTVMFNNWVISFFIILCLPFLMSIILNMTEFVISVSYDNKSYEELFGITVYVANLNGQDASSVDPNSVDIAGSFSFKTNLIGLTRFNMQTENTVEKWLYTLLYLGLVFCTVVFTFLYHVRLYVMIGLTIFAPIFVIWELLSHISDNTQMFKFGQMNKGPITNKFYIWLIAYFVIDFVPQLLYMLYGLFIQDCINLVCYQPIYPTAVIGALFILLLYCIWKIAVKILKL